MAPTASYQIMFPVFIDSFSTGVHEWYFQKLAFIPINPSCSWTELKVRLKTILVKQHGGSGRTDIRLSSGGPGRALINHPARPGGPEQHLELCRLQLSGPEPLPTQKNTKARLTFIRTHLDDPSLLGKYSVGFNGRFWTFTAGLDPAPEPHGYSKARRW